MGTLVVVLFSILVCKVGVLVSTSEDHLGVGGPGTDGVEAHPFSEPQARRLPPLAPTFCSERLGAGPALALRTPQWEYVFLTLVLGTRQLLRRGVWFSQIDGLLLPLTVIVDPPTRLRRWTWRKSGLIRGGTSVTERRPLSFKFLYAGLGKRRVKYPLSLV